MNKNDNNIFWLDKAISLAKEDKIDASMKEIAKGSYAIKEEIINGNKTSIEKLKEAINLLDPEDHSDLILIALIRNTYAIRELFLEEWTSLLRRSKIVLDKRGSKTEDCLRGLLQILSGG